MSSSSQPRPSLARLATRGALWAGFSQYLLFAIGLLKTIILARLIGREYFGLLAGAVAWSSYFAFGRLELRLAVYSSKEESSVLNTQFLIENASALTGLILAGAVVLAWPRLVSPAGTWPLIFVLLVASLFETLTSTPAYLVEKRLRQDVTGRFTVFASLVGFIIPVALAFGGAALPALLMDLLLPTLITRIGAMLFIRWWPTFIWDRTEIINQLRLGWTMWWTGVLGKITFLFDDWLVYNVNRPHPTIWRGSGVEPEALYSRAYNVGKMPMDVAAGMIGSIALSLYSESAARGREVLAAAYRQLTWILSWLIFFSSAVAFVAADDVVYILGEQWVPMVPLFRLMFLFVVGRSLFQNNAQLLLAMRAERDFQRTMTVQAVFILLACPPAVYFLGAAGASVVVSLMSMIGFVATERRVAHHLGLSMWHVYLVPACSAILVIGLVTLLAPALPENIWLSAIVKGLISAAVFGAALLAFERKTAWEAWRTLRQGLGRR